MAVLFGFLAVVLNEEESEDDKVHEDGFGEGEALASEASDALAQCEVESLDVVCLSFFFAARLMLAFGQHLLIRLPQVAKAKGALVVCGNLVPQSATGAGASVTPMPGDHLSCSSTQRHPQPNRLLLAPHEAP